MKKMVQVLRLHVKSKLYIKPGSLVSVGGLLFGLKTILIMRVTRLSWHAAVDATHIVTLTHCMLLLFLPFWLFIFPTV